MLSVALGLIGAIIAGSADFFGGMAARSTSSIRVTSIASAPAFLVAVILAFFIPTRWSAAAILWGGVAGVAAALALVLLYSCLAMGPMSVLAPLIALISAVLPIAIEFARGLRLSFAGDAGLVIGLIAVILICFVPGAGAVRPSIRGIIYAVGAGLLIGAYLLSIDLSPRDSGPAPLIVTLAVVGIVMLLILAVQRTRGPFPAIGRPTWLFALACGVTDALGGLAILAALRVGDLSVVSVLNALAPAGTIVLALLILRERIAVVQWVGLAVAIGAAALLALA